MATVGDAVKMLIASFVIIYSIQVVLCHDRPDNYAFNPGMHDHTEFGTAKPMRYLLYEVNPGEGFNLRRDVYMRVANLVKKLNEDEPWTLVLPPWGRLYHWKSPIDQIQVPWSMFFDIKSLNQHVPVIEFEQYLKITGKPVIDEIYYLQRYKEGWTNGKWEEKMDERECLDHTGFNKDKDGLWHWWFWGYEEVYAKKFTCISIQAQSTFVKPFLMKNTTGRGVMLMRMEHVMHAGYGKKLYWEARRSLVFAKHLREIGDSFRRSQLQSTDEEDNTIWDDDWVNMKRNHGEAKGGPYISVHLRRRDFLYGHSKDVPSLKSAAKQLKQILDKYKLDTLFVATDAPKEEVEDLKTYLEGYHVVQYIPPADVLSQYKDGGVAIIDQWICAHARYFIGTSQSTFSFRIQEEREILGFDPEMTFNRLCGDEEKECEGPSKWYIKYE